MKTRFVGKIFLGLCVLFFLFQTSVRAERETLAVSTIKPTPGVVQSVEKAGKRVAMDRVLQSLDGQLIDRINATRKFQIVGRSDVSDLILEQDFANSGNVDAADKSSAQHSKIAGAKYLLVTTVDDFQDYNETATLQGSGRNVTKRVVKMSCVGKIYDATTGKLLESTNLQTSNKDFLENKPNVTRDGTPSDEMLVSAAHEMAEKIANRVANVIFPTKVISKREKQITINRGEGTDIAVGQNWNVYAVGEELIDPDTKESLGKEEVLIGKVKILSVLPKTSTAEIVEDFGIDKGAVVRKAQ